MLEISILKGFEHPGVALHMVEHPVLELRGEYDGLHRYRGQRLHDTLELLRQAVRACYVSDDKTRHSGQQVDGLVCITGTWNPEIENYRDIIESFQLFANRVENDFLFGTEVTEDQHDLGAHGVDETLQPPVVPQQI